jgi:uncharacterized protein
VGAIAPRKHGFTHPRVYFATDDVDASVKRSHELGGANGDAQTVPGIGRIAQCQDDRAPHSASTNPHRKTEQPVR